MNYKEREINTLIWILFLTFVISALGCANDYKFNTLRGADGKNCSVSAISNGSLISCPDGSSQVVFNGANGQNGVDGINGSNGSDGLDGANGSDGQNGYDGTNGQNGNDGHDGSQGIPGVTGPQGPAGQPGTQISIVQFCPGASHYPSNFPEVGLCINGNLYAVYSANDGFMTFVPPGAYHSNAVGSVCNFTVLQNCIIQ